MLRRVVLILFAICGGLSCKWIEADNGFISAAKCGGAHQPRLPIKLQLQDPSRQWDQITTAVVAWWGPNYFTLVGDDGSESPDVIIRTDATMINGAATKIIIDDKTCEALFTEVILPVTTDLTPERMLAHELGHVLGLAHDSSSGSLMYPTTQVGMESFVLTTGDRERLTDKYHQIPNAPPYQSFVKAHAMKYNTSPHAASSQKLTDTSLFSEALSREEKRNLSEPVTITFFVPSPAQGLIDHEAPEAR